MGKVVIAISGGIDSLVTAFLLKKKKFNILGINFFTGFEAGFKKSNLKKKLDKISKKLCIKIKIIDIQKQFRKTVVKYFLETFQNGKTPNPCIICNEKIKFGLLLKIAKKFGAFKIATGHYARIFKDLNGKFYISKGFDKCKDQSYFLSRLDQKQIPFIVFPIGNMTKNQVMKIAIDNNLMIDSGKESQDVCFINDKSYIEFIQSCRIKESLSGAVVTVSETTLEKHKGLINYTIGQGLNVANLGMSKKFVVKIYKKKNEVVVDSVKFLRSGTCFVTNIVWYSNNPYNSICVYVKIRYKHIRTIAVIVPISNDSAVLNFEFSQLSVTPGQCIVFYQRKHIIGSGWIK